MTFRKKENSYDIAYRKFEENLPWCLEEIPSCFKKLITSKEIPACKTLDVGCGTGNYAKYLSLMGFEVLGIDFSEKAIELARRKYISEKRLTFNVGNAFSLSKINQKFDFIYEVSLLHNIPPRKREQYIDQILSVLNSKGKFLVCCFSDQDEHFKGNKEVYFPDLDNTVYPLSEKELVSLFSKNFYIKKIEKVFFGRTNKRKKERFLCLLEKK
jgi:ubiquinone/menaquinone biosynthesis C-methylase UbiE